MDHNYQAVILGTIFIMLVWVYFYIIYRERYLGFWLISWIIFFGRIVIFDLASTGWKENLLGFTIFQFSFFLCGLFFLKGTYLLINKPFPILWLYSGGGAFILSFLLTLLKLPMVYKLLPPAIYGSIILIYIGKIFVYDLKIKGIGNLIAGYSFIIWGLISVFMSYTLNIPRLTYWAHLLSGYLRLAIAVGTTVVYFEKSRSDLAAKEAYRLLTENAVDVIYHYQLLPAPHFAYISPAVFPITGYTPEEYYADANLMSSLIYLDDLPLFDKFLNQPLTSAGDLPLTIRLTRKDGNITWIEPKGVVLYGKNGIPTGLEGIIRDITVRKNMEKLMGLAENMNMVGQMAVSVAHEIRNPLTSVRGFLQMMAKTEKRNTVKERYSLMINELDRTNEIISEYLMLSKNKVSNRKNSCLNHIINTLLPLLQVTASACNGKIKLALGNIPPLSLDENEIRQLLLNLINNGLEAMPTGGELVIRTYCDQGKVVLSIADHGPGISSSILEHLGTPFLTTKNNGTGLGLPICYRIASRHNAAIRVETSTHGTTFYVQFNLS